MCRTRVNLSFCYRSVMSIFPQAMTGTSRLRNDVGAALRRSLLLGVTITLGIFAVLAVPLALDSGLDAVRLQSTQSCAQFASDTDAAGWTTRRIDPNRIEVSHENEPV